MAVYIVRRSSGRFSSSSGSTPLPSVLPDGHPAGRPGPGHRRPARVRRRCRPDPPPARARPARVQPAGGVSRPGDPGRPRPLVQPGPRRPAAPDQPFPGDPPARAGRTRRRACHRSCRLGVMAPSIEGWFDRSATITDVLVAAPSFWVGSCSSTTWRSNRSPGPTSIFPSAAPSRATCASSPRRPSPSASPGPPTTSASCGR
jgi:hypothetical protein